MSRLDLIQEQLAAHGTALEGLEAIGEIARDALKASHHDTMAMALSVVTKIVEAIFSAFEGGGSPDDVKALVEGYIHKTLDELASHDAKHDDRLKALDKKFDNGDDTNG